LAEYRRLHPRVSMGSGILDVWAAWFELHWQTAEEDGAVATHHRTLYAFRVFSRRATLAPYTMP